MTPADRLVSATGSEDERQLEAALRPRRLADFTGQHRLKENLQIAIDAARKRGEAMDHVLLYGPPGLGKTTLASIIAQELEVGFQQTSGPVMQKKLDLSGILSGIQPRQVFFIDEIHRLLPDVEEMLYSALEDFHLDILIGTGPGARTHSIPLQKFTAIGATTRQGLVSGPLRGRFGLVLRLNHYDVPGTEVDRRAIRAMACWTRQSTTKGRDPRSPVAWAGARGTPRIANRLLRRVRDYAEKCAPAAKHHGGCRGNGAQSARSRSVLAGLTRSIRKSCARCSEREIRGSGARWGSIRSCRRHRRRGRDH